MNFIQKNIYTILFSFALVAFFVSRIPVLNLPFYWDEAWSYAKAVNEMYEKGTTLLPNHLNQEIFRGHPLFFYFLTSGVAQIVGFTPFSMHLLMLALYSILIGFFYLSLKKMFNENIALLASLFLLLQEIFIAQSVFLLPEVLITFLTYFTFYFYFKRQFLYYIIVGTMLVLTKESGIVAIGTVCVYQFYLFLKNSKVLWHVFGSSIPLIIFGLFLLLQKILWGWYLFPEHIGYMQISWEILKVRSIDIMNCVFGKTNLIFSIIILLSLLLMFYKREIFKLKKYSELISILILFTMLYTFFSAINFFTLRYVLSLFPVFAIFFSGALYYIIKSNFTFFSPFALVSILLVNYFCLNHHGKNSIGDCSTNYRKQVLVVKNIFDKYVNTDTIHTFRGDFLVNENLQNPSFGYVRKQRTIQWELPADYIIYASNEGNSESINDRLKNKEIVFVDSDSLYPAWCSIYKQLK
jgi:4-amino-4-deoxy-L-arabinose transferase-like glycosyltransferase